MHKKRLYGRENSNTLFDMLLRYWDDVVTLHKEIYQRFHPLPTLALT